MAGKSWQPSQPWAPRSKRNRHPSHCWNSGMRVGKGVGEELPGRWAATTKLPEKCLQYVRHAMIHEHMDSNTCAYLSTALTTRETQALFAVNSIKLHLTAFNLQFDNSLTYCSISHRTKELELQNLVNFLFISILYTYIIMKRFLNSGLFWKYFVQWRNIGHNWLFIWMVCVNQVWHKKIKTVQ